MIPSFPKILLLVILVNQVQSKPEGLTVTDIMATAVPLVGNLYSSSSEESLDSAVEADYLQNQSTEIIEPELEAILSEDLMVKMNEDLEKTRKILTLTDQPWIKELILASTVFLAILLLVAVTYTMFWKNVRAIIMEFYDWARTGRKEEGAIYFTAPRRRDQDRPVS